MTSDLKVIEPTGVDLPGVGSPLSYYRNDRLHAGAEEDQRTPFQRDRDRILYSSAFHRLAGITQVVRAGESDTLHTRQQHSYKVAQIGRRLAEKCLVEGAQVEELDPEVVEAACLAHDLGHPPFGHAGEHTLSRLVEEFGDDEGFEGNAQTFRIVAKLAVRFDECHGLDLTRATLCGCLKYPWFRDITIDGKNKKWGAYRSEREDFDFARKLISGEEKSIEAKLMDWSDDIAYSVHDLEDFHRLGLIPWTRLLRYNNKGQPEITDAAHAAIERANRNWYDKPVDSLSKLKSAWEELSSMLYLYWDLLGSPYTGERDQRAQVRNLTSALVSDLVRATTFSTGVEIAPEAQVRVRLMKQITRDHAIENPSLVAQQKGQSRIIEGLFKTLYADSEQGPPPYVPHRLNYLLRDFTVSRARRVSDAIASLTEREATDLYARLFGVSYGSVLDPIAR